MNAAEWTVAASTFRQSFLSKPSEYFEDQTELLAFGRVMSLTGGVERAVDCYCCPVGFLCVYVIDYV